MASTTYAGHTYTQVDTTFNGDVAVKIDELSGRQGDNMRPVYLQLVQTTSLSATGPDERWRDDSLEPVQP